MIDYARPFEPNMCELYFPPSSPAPARLDDFQVFKKGPASHIYSNYYANASYDAYAEPDIDGCHKQYQTLVSCRDYYRDDWKTKFLVNWNEDDTVAWVVDALYSLGISEHDMPFHNFRVTGPELRSMNQEEIVQRVAHPTLDPITSRRIGENLFDKLQSRLNEDRVSYERSVGPSYQQHEPGPNVLDLDTLNHRTRGYGSDYRPNDSSLLQGACDSSDDAEDVFRSSGTASPECSYGSDVSKSGDEDDKHKRQFKRPPGRPKGSGRKVCKRPRSVSVPEFLRNLLYDPKYCPSIIKWEDRANGKFRFVKPDEVAKLWGKLKQNDNMTFEKFSRAMRYHYKQSVLVSVPTARLVYQFGPKGPDFRTDHPNFVQVKTEMAELSYT